MRKKIIKYVSVFVACIIAFSLFTISASAEEKQTLFSDFWTLNTSDSKVWILDTDAGGVLTDITNDVTFVNQLNGELMLIQFKANQNWGANNILFFNFVFDLNSCYVNPGVSSLKFTLYDNQRNNSLLAFTSTEPNDNTGKVYAPWAYRDGNYSIDGVSRRDYQETHSVPSYNNLRVTYEFNNHNSQYGFKRVCAFAYCTLLAPLSELNYNVAFNIANLDYRYSTEGEYLNQQIIDSQDKNTDKLLNGDTDLDSSGQTNQVNGTVGGIDEATNNALGGKSEAEIQAEVNGALDFNKISGSLDYTIANRMSSFYDRCLTVFGPKYNSLLLLSLVLGLGAFLIGRRYG